MSSPPSSRLARPFLIAALLTASLPASNAFAAPNSKVSINQTYTLACALNQTDGVSLRSGVILAKNTSGVVIPAGAKITVLIKVRNYYTKRIFYVTRTVVVTATSTLQVGDSVRVEQPRHAVSCNASVSLFYPPRLSR